MKEKEKGLQNHRADILRRSSKLILLLRRSEKSIWNLGRPQKRVKP
jgi:hypothetical protein